MNTISTPISVIIPSYNACERLYLTLEGFKNQTYDHSQFEVIVIDDGSTDLTSKMLGKIHCDFQLNIVKLENNADRSAARNKGILSAQGKILIFNDADMIPSKDYIKNHMDSHDRENSVVVGPIWHHIFTYYYDNEGFKREYEKPLKSLKISRNNNILKYPKKGVTQLITIEKISKDRFLKYSYVPTWAKWYLNFIEKYGTNFKEFYFPWIFLSSGNFSINKKNITTVDMFDENFSGWGGEDWDLGYRLYKHGMNFYYNENCLSVHQEHPYSTKKRSVSSNCNTQYMIEKYKDFEVTILHRASHLGYDKLNQAVKEYHDLKNNSNYRHLIPYINILVNAYGNKKSNDNSINIEIDNNLNDSLKILSKEAKVLKNIFGLNSSLFCMVNNLIKEF